MYQSVSLPVPRPGARESTPVRVVAIVLTAVFFWAARAFAARATVDESHTLESWPQSALGRTKLPSRTYSFAAWVKRSNIASAAAAQFALSPDWTTRRTFPTGEYAWTEVTWAYKTLAPQRKFDYRFLKQDTGAIWIDDSNRYTWNQARVCAARTKLEAF